MELCLHFLVFLYVIAMFKSVHSVYAILYCFFPPYCCIKYFIINKLPSFKYLINEYFDSESRIMHHSFKYIFMGLINTFFLQVPKMRYYDGSSCSSISQEFLNHVNFSCRSRIPPQEGGTILDNACGCGYVATSQWS